MKKSLIEYLITEPMREHGPDYVITIHNDRAYTYKDYALSLQRVSKVLKAFGVKKEAVILQMDDSFACIVLFLSLIHIGAKPLILSPKTRKEAMTEILKIAECRIVISTKEIECIWGRDQEWLEIDKIDQIPFGMNKNKELSLREIDSNIAYLSLTSGSSGIPKIVMHNEQEMQYATHFYAERTLGICKKDILFSAAKINFTYGMANSVFFSLATGAKAILYTDVLTSDQILNYIQRYQATCFFAVPTVYRAIIENVEQKDSYTESVRMFVSAGEYLPAAINKKWKEFSGKYIIDSVGCSETGSAYLVNRNPEKKMGSAGCVVEGYQVVLDGGSEGALCVGGRSNAMGYLNDEENTKLKFQNGQVITGDFFTKDEDGYYWFIGRKDDMIKKNGRWVSYNEINMAAKHCKSIRNAVSFKALDDNIVLAAEVDEKYYDSEKLLEELREKLEHYKCPKSILVVDEIPVNGNGKTDYKELRERYEQTL